MLVVVVVVVMVVIVILEVVVSLENGRPRTQPFFPCGVKSYQCAKHWYSSASLG